MADWLTNWLADWFTYLVGKPVDCRIHEVIDWITDGVIVRPSYWLIHRFVILQVWAGSKSGVIYVLDAKNVKVEKVLYTF